MDREVQQHKWLCRYIGAVAVLGALGVAGVAVAADPHQSGAWLDVFMVAALAALTFWFPFLRTGTAGARSYHLIEAPLAAGLLLLDPRRAMAAFVLGVTVHWVASKRSALKTVYGIGSHAGGGAVAVLFVVAAGALNLPGGPRAYVPIAILGYFAANLLMNSVVFELAGVRRPGEPFFVDFGWSAFVSGVALATGGFMGLAGRSGAGAVVLSTVPIALVFVLSRAHANRSRTVELLQGIVDASGDTHAGMSVPEVEAAVCARVVQVLDCPDAEIRPDPPIAFEIGAAIPTQNGSRWLVAKPRAVERFRAEETRLLRALAGMASRALENASLHDQLARQALHDPLTGVPNRRLVIRELNAAVARARRASGRVGVAFLDLTGFKAVNDGLGHDAGDELLCLIAERLMRSVRLGDVVGRFGGDEFVVLFLPHDDSDVAAAAARVVQSFKQPFLISGQSVNVGCNVGLALWPDHGDDADELLRRADSAMYTAKRAGATLAMATSPLPTAALPTSTVAAR